MDEDAHDAAEAVSFGRRDAEGGEELGEGHGSAMVVDEVGYAQLKGALEAQGGDVAEQVVPYVGLSLEELAAPLKATPWAPSSSAD